MLDLYLKNVFLGSQLEPKMIDYVPQKLSFFESNYSVIEKAIFQLNVL